MLRGWRPVSDSASNSKYSRSSRIESAIADLEEPLAPMAAPTVRPFSNAARCPR
jgi:hypothetical protein